MLEEKTTHLQSGDALVPPGLGLWEERRISGNVLEEFIQVRMSGAQQMSEIGNTMMEDFGRK